MVLLSLKWWSVNKCLKLHCVLNWTMLLPWEFEALKILHKAGAIDELNSFKTRGCKLSGPGALSGFSLISSFLIPFTVIVMEGIIRRLVWSANRFLTAALATRLSVIGLDLEKILLKCWQFCFIFGVRYDRVPPFECWDSPLARTGMLNERPEAFAK